MDNTEIHYLSYDPDEIWNEMIAAYVDAGGDILYPGDEKEMLLRGVQSMITQVFAGVDNALRMQTLRYAVYDYLDILGEQRGCYRIAESAAKCEVQIIFRATGQARTMSAGTAMTADGEKFFILTEDVPQTGYAQTVNATVICNQAGSAGNGLLSGTQMQLAVSNPAVISIYTIRDAAGGNEREDDETYRERIRLYGLASVTTGPASQYEAMAMRVSAQILDAKAICLAAGSVGVCLILDDAADAEDVLQAVEDALSATDVRPLTDYVTVYQATDVPYEITAQYSAEAGSDILSALQQTTTQYQKWQDESVGRAFNPDRLMAMLYQAGATRVVWGSSSHFNEGVVAYTEIDEDERCKGTITLEVLPE